MESANKFLTKPNLINESNLDKNQYTLSLLLEGLRGGFIDKPTIDNIQVQIMFLLKNLILRYTNGKSTSVAVETAEKILNSILYSIDSCIENYSNPQEALNALINENVNEIYAKGLERIKLCTNETKKLYLEVKKNKLDVLLEAYNSTIDTAFEDFFAKYDMVFSAHDTMASIDYPLAFDDMNIKGIFYIRQYLEKLQMENEFCRSFSKEDIAKTLKNYGRTYCIDYTVTLVNIFEIILFNSIFSVLSGNSGKRLSISITQLRLLKSKFTGLNSFELSSLIDTAIQQVIDNLDIRQEKLTDYIYKYKAILLHRIMNAVNNESLQNIVITEDDDKSSDSIVFQDGSRMSNDSFSRLVSEIIKCKNSADKVNIIKLKINSLQDLIDVLDGDCLFEDEYIELFNSMSDIEISILGRIVFCDELRNGLLELSPDNLYDMDVDFEWQTQYIKFMRTLSKEKIESILNLINNSI